MVEGTVTGLWPSCELSGRAQWRRVSGGDRSRPARQTPLPQPQTISFSPHPLFGSSRAMADNTKRDDWLSGGAGSATAGVKKDEPVQAGGDLFNSFGTISTSRQEKAELAAQKKEEEVCRPRTGQADLRRTGC